MNTSKYYIGNCAKDARRGLHHGWIVGTFMEKGARKTTDLEVKYWRFPKGPTNHDTKTSTTYEFTMVIEGQVRGRVNGRTIILHHGEYIVIPPHIRNNVVSLVVKAAKGITVKAPSDPKAKIVHEDK